MKLKNKSVPIINGTISKAIIFMVAFGAPVSVAWCAGGWFAGNNVNYLGGGDSRPCIFFTLTGVSEAVAGVPGSPWFVLPKTHAQFKETYALLLSAKLTGRQVDVATTGNVHSCGHAEVVSVGMP